MKRITPGASGISCDKLLSPGEKYNCYLKDVNSVCPCSAGQRVTCDFVINFETKNGLTKTETFTIINDCTDQEITNPNQQIIPQTYNLSLTTNPINIGSTTGEGTYEAGEVITITATPQENYVFINWTTPNGGTFENSQSAQTSYTMPTNQTTITANFEYNDPYNFIELTPASSSELKSIIESNGCDKNYKLMNNIDSTNETLSSSICVGQFGTYGYNGIFDGGGHKIENLTITNGDYYNGLFRALNEGSSVTNLGLENIQVTGYGIVGGIAGRAYKATIQNSYVSGSISGQQGSIGGIVGTSQDSEIINCYSTATVTSASPSVGGITSYLNSGSTITNSFSTGTIQSWSGNGMVYSKSADSTITNSYWDIVLSGRNNCYTDGNIGCTFTNNEAELYYGSNGIPFTQLNWDTQIWEASENSFPILLEQN